MSAGSKVAPSTSAGTSANANVPSTSAPTPPANVQEFNIRVPKNLRKKHHVMRFNATLNVDFAQWRNVKLERENNMKEFKGAEEEMPKFGAGSEYNRDLREEVRRKKFGIIAKKYRPEAQPWILKVGGKSGKKFKGIREGGVSENAAFYVFTHAPDGAIEAYPLNEWYNFQPIQRYKSLSAEEAEQEFGRRKKVMNYFTLMLRKRLKGDEEEEKDPEEVKVKGAGKKSKELKISEMDEWIDSEEESDSDSDGEEKKKKEDDSDDDGKKKGKKGKGAEKKKKKQDVDDEAFEESDDGDEEGREMDYDTESSEDEPDPEAKLDKDMKSVAEEDALRKLLTSDEEDEEENKSDESDKEDDEKKKKDKTKDENKDKKKSKNKGKDDKKDSSSDFSSDSSDSEDDNKTKKKDNSKPMSNQNSRSATPTFNNDANKRKMNSMPSDLTASENSNSPVSTPAKRPKTEVSTPSLPSTFAGVVSSNSKDDYGITEEAVRRYLMRKPMTATELLTKFKNKKTGVSSDRLVETMTQILKKINPVKQTIQGKMYLSIKVNK
ncbi:transcription factor IIFalpha [Cochliomyia hominivorax]